ncbi:phosphotransferase [Nocardioides daeguensis]|uniref:Aminoglycoside phosphotransferase n=1 Tax=Nocardioides daeguensis TaxID=908359 RepID=A0ABP6W6W4_9ACTN|nr:phosphotransferase [Nocardioides daeguensis]MBV6727682.1 aminoglycoside phosphotransferase [Nocardioides daeguensis]MCR1775154.1 aminoglycoside phosphotransferase [Nocardioides daeguensis]
MTDPRPVVDSVAALLDGATERAVLDAPGRSGAVLERVRIGGRPYVVKYLDHDADWSLRAAGVPGSPTLVLWQRGILDLLPQEIAQPIVAVARERARPTLSAVLMRDVGPWLVPAVDDPIGVEQNARFLDHMAALHAAFWESDLDLDVVAPRDRYLELSPRMAEAEAARGSGHLVPGLVAQGWPRLESVAPRAAAVVVPLVEEPGPLLAALAGTPQTLVHGNWKLDNLGTDAAGRTVLLDWETPGRGAGTADLAWYLAINCRRLPVSKEQAIVDYRTALERRGVATEPWWERQLALALLGALVQFGWEKALGGYDDELAWWEERAVRAAALLG